MSIKEQALDIVEAYNPMWSVVVGEALLSKLPDDERLQVLEILYTMRVSEVERTLRYAKVVGNPRKKNKFLAETKSVSEHFRSMMEEKLSA